MNKRQLNPECCFGSCCHGPGVFLQGVLGLEGSLELIFLGLRSSKPLAGRLAGFLMGGLAQDLCDLL